jgi:signal peptidase II
MSAEIAVEKAPSPITPNGWLAYGIATASVALDQLSKAWVLYGLDLPEQFRIPVLPPLLNFTMVWNSGVSFHLLATDNALGRTLLILFAVAVVGVLGWWARKADRRLTAVALGLVMGGALGNNLIDRIRFGRVADFIDVSQALPFFPWVFNVADSAISIGVVLLLIDTLKPQPAAAGSAPPAT